MDFLDPKKRRAQRIQLYIGYGLMAVALGIATLILFFVTFGYGVDRKTGSVIQNGLLFVDAHPEAATIYINGQNKGTTSNRLTVPSGQYTMQLKRSGYRTWQRGFTLEGAGVERFVYPLLFPEKLVTKDVDLFTVAPGMTTESPDRHWFVLEQGTSLTNFDQVDLNSTDNTTASLSFPNDLFTAGTGDQRIEVIEWSSDNRHILVKHTYNAGADYEFVMMDREQPDSSLNLTKQFVSTPMTNVRLHNKRFDQLYILNTADGSLSTLDTKSKQVVTVASHVADFKPYGDNQVLYVTSEGAVPGLMLVKLKDGSLSYSLRTFSANTSYFLDMTQYSGNTYVVVGAVDEGRVYEYKDPIDALKKTPAVAPVPVALLKVDAPQFVSFSQNNRFVEIQGATKFAVYDAETERQYRYDTKLILDVPAKATWMDGHHLVMLSGGKSIVFDYDGTNFQTLAPANAGYGVFFDRDYSALYSIGPSIGIKDHSALTRTELKVK